MYKGKGVTPSSGRVMMLPDDPRVEDSTNDGLINAATWNVSMENGTKTHEEMIDRLYRDNAI